jgi:hypothetical protein
MSMLFHGVFTNRSEPPTDLQLAGALGAKRALWDTLLDFVDRHHGSPPELVYAGRNAGWSLRFRKNGRALLSMMPGAESFTVVVVLNEAQTADALKLPIGKRILDQLRQAPVDPDGRWLLIPVSSAKTVKDIEALLAVKAKPRHAAYR